MRNNKKKISSIEETIKDFSDYSKKLLANPVKSLEFLIQLDKKLNNDTSELEDKLKIALRKEKLKRILK